MKPPTSRLIRTGGPVLAMLVLAGWVVYDWTRDRGVSVATAVVSGRNLLESRSPDAPVEEVLEELTWADIVTTVEGTNLNPSSRTALITAAASSARPQVGYLRGLLLLSADRREDALAAFWSIPLNDIPVPELYAPYRLQATQRPDAPNPFEGRLVSARAARQLPPLLDARLAADHGDLPGALQGYLRSDPGTWATYDLAAFRMLRLHAGLSLDARSMLAAALRAGRVRNNLRPALLQLVETPDIKGASAQGLESLKALLRRDPTARRIAIEATATQLRARQLFLAHRYRELSAEYRNQATVQIPDGTLVIVMLASAQAGDIVLFNRWSQELRRRYPREDVTAWIASLGVPHS